MGAALVVLGLTSWKRVRGRLPDTNKLLITRGPGNARGGITMVAVLAVAMGGILSIYLPPATGKDLATWRDPYRNAGYGPL